jgi:hypothetical protein
MSKCIVCVHDKGAEVFNTPIFVPGTGVAIRQFTDEVNRKEDNNALYNHPLDFSLYLIGVFDEVTGNIVTDVRKLVDASAVKRTE